jgi:hypothetical protein
MSNPFLEYGSDEIETAIIYGNAKVIDIGNAVAYTDGNKLFINTDDNLYKILPNYNEGMLKWLLWHEKFHMELRHHKRYFKFLDDARREKDKKLCNLTHNEVNIIMDILVHDSLCKMFPELIETAKANLAQLRNRNSLKYTFTTYNLEDMLKEYAEHKKDESGKGKDETEPTKHKTGEGESEGIGEKESDDTKGKSTKTKEDKTTAKDKKTHDEDDKDDPKKKSTSRAEDGEPEEIDGTEKTTTPEEVSEHTDADWSKLDKIDSKEFIETREADIIEETINKLKRKRLKIGKLTRQLNGLASTKRDRTYRLPSMLQTTDGCIFKGKTQGKTELYLVFDASGSMSGEIRTFKEIITKSIPQAMKCPCEWFAGHYNSDDRLKAPEPYKTEEYEHYYKSTYKDFVPVRASGGYDDDGDRVIELCWQAEQKGYSPIGVTDGGGKLSWSKDKLKQLRRTVLVGQNSHWLEKVKRINPSIQTLDIDV